MNRLSLFTAAALCVAAIAAIPAEAQMPDLPEVNLPTPTPTPPPQSAVGSSQRAWDTAMGKTEMSWTPRKGQQSWEEFIADWLTPRKVAKSAAIRIDDKHAFPHPAVALKMEIVKEDDTYLWLRGIPPEQPESPLHGLWAQRQAGERILKERLDWEKEHGSINYWLDYNREIVPPPFVDSLEFEAHNTGLPTNGLWQMDFAVADMDSDGIDDLVFPPARKGIAQPAIYKGLEDAGFRLMKEAAWLRGIPYDYGSVAVGDFDSDGNLDIVLAIHFKQQYVLFGDGHGAFPRSKRLAAPDPRLTSRGCTVADFNGDGRDDIAFIAELDVDMSTSQRIESRSTVWIQLQTDDGFEMVTEGLPIVVISDDIEAADVDQDGRTDLVLASNTADWRKLVYLNTEDGWKENFSFGVLSNTYHFDVETNLRDDGTFEVYAAFMQYRVIAGKNTARTGLIRYEWTEDGLVAPKGAVYFDDDRTNPYVRLCLGDVNNDGILDIVAGRKLGGLEVWIGTGGGDFVLEQSSELTGLGRVFDIKLIDVDGDGLDDILACFAAVEESPGGVRLWLTRSRE